MKPNVNEVFKEACEGLEFDAKLAKKIRLYAQAFVNKNSDHIQFFGGKLLGVEVVRFTPSDRDRWFHEILEIDEGPVTDRIVELPDINEDFFVSSDTMNLSCVWMCHMFMNTTKLNQAQKHDAMIDTLLVLHFKYTTSLMFQYYRFPADKQIAEATYNNLTRKFAIKTADSWYSLLVDRCENVIKPGEIHYNTVKDMNDDERVVYMLNDTQGRIRGMIKNITTEFHETIAKGSRIVSTSSVIKHDGNEILKDRTKGLLTYGQYLNSIITDKNSFIRPELVQLIVKLQNTMNPRMFSETLEWMSANYRQRGAGLVEEVLQETLVHSFRYLASDRRAMQDPNNLPELLMRLRGVYMASRGSDLELLSLREKTETIVTMATGNKNKSNIASIRTGVLLYLVLRAFTMRHYTQGV